MGDREIHLIALLSQAVGELRGVGYPNERLERVLEEIVEDVEIREVSGG